ncbi:MAG: peroxiredoxin [Candidatus Thorarchaeota archaeon]
MLKKGDTAPDFETVTETGEPFSMKSFRGKKFMLFFYPKDNTPGCKAEVCSLRDSYSVFENNDIPVYGTSGGTEKTHRSFSKKNNLPFPLLIDTDFTIAKLYQIYKPKKMMGREFMGIVRTTFLIDKEGTIEEIFGGSEGVDKVRVKEHAGQVLNFWGLNM